MSTFDVILYGEGYTQRTSDLPDTTTKTPLGRLRLDEDCIQASQSLRALANDNVVLELSSGSAIVVARNVSQKHYDMLYTDFADPHSILPFETLIERAVERLAGKENIDFDLDYRLLCMAKDEKVLGGQAEKSIEATFVKSELSQAEGVAMNKRALRAIRSMLGPRLLTWFACNEESIFEPSKFDGAMTLKYEEYFDGNDDFVRKDDGSYAYANTEHRFYLFASSAKIAKQGKELMEQFLAHASPRVYDPDPITESSHVAVQIRPDTITQSVRYLWHDVVTSEERNLLLQLIGQNVLSGLQVADMRYTGNKDDIPLFIALLKLPTLRWMRVVNWCNKLEDHSAMLCKLREAAPDLFLQRYVMSSVSPDFGGPPDSVKRQCAFQAYSMSAVGFITPDECDEFDVECAAYE